MSDHFGTLCIKGFKHNSVFQNSFLRKHVVNLRNTLPCHHNFIILKWYNIPKHNVEIGQNIQERVKWRKRWKLIETNIAEAHITEVQPPSSTGNPCPRSMPLLYIFSNLPVMTFFDNITPIKDRINTKTNS